MSDHTSGTRADRLDGYRTCTRWVDTGTGEAWSGKTTACWSTRGVTGAALQMHLLMSSSLGWGTGTCTSHRGELAAEAGNNWLSFVCISRGQNSPRTTRNSVGLPKMVTAVVRWTTTIFWNIFSFLVCYFA